MTKHHDIEDIEIRINDAYLSSFSFIERNESFSGGILTSSERTKTSEEIKCKYIVRKIRLVKIAPFSY